MRYVKNKRDKRSICNLCREEKDLSWDHVPPKGGIEISSVEMQTVFQKLTAGKDTHKVKESQNGVKYRTICKECNSLLGREYDPILNNFATSVGRYLKTSLKLPPVINHTVKLQRLFKSLLGHMVASKVEVEDTLFDTVAREYVLDSSLTLPDEINIFYWVYPYSNSLVIRDFLMFSLEKAHNKPEIFQMFKYYPIAYLCCSKKEYYGLPNLGKYRNCELDEEIQMQINLSRVEESDWPEIPCDERGNVFMGGNSAMNSIYANKRF